MQTLSYCLIVVLLVATVTRHGVCKPASEVKPIEGNAEITKRGLEKFSINFLKKTSLLADPKLNLILSPFSVWTLLLLIFEGAKGSSRTQISKCLGFPENQIRQNYDKISTDLKTKSTLDGVIVESINGLIMDSNLHIEKDYSRAVEHTYQSNILPIDFANPENATQVINDWVQINTRYRILELVRPDDLNLAKLVLANVIYFKGAWSFPFNVTETKTADFHDARGKLNGKVKMMTQRGPYHFSLVPPLESQVVELPYESSSLAMLVILPQGDATIDSVLEKLSTTVSVEDIFNQLQDDMDYYGEGEVIVSLPKFKIESDLTINIVLEEMGITDAFSPSKANLTGISKSDSLFISRAMHKAEIVVNEEGTEASAITSSIFVNKSTTPHFKANKPFLFLVVEKITNIILFAGRFSTPPEMEDTSPPKH